MDLGLDNKVALVTGGGKGIGRAVVKSLLAEGARVVLVDRDLAAAEAVRNEFAEVGERLFFVTGDLTNESVCQTVIDQAIEQFGTIDILVNNAGVNDSTGFACAESVLLTSLQRNLFHVVTLTRLAASHLAQNRGAIVNVSSKVAVTGQGGTTGYAAAKGALNALTREWAVDFADRSVRVNTVVPAECWTPLYSDWVDAQPDPTAAKESIANLVPLGRRFTTPEEIADTIVFLASPRSSHTTGQIVFVDGGYTHLDRKLSAATNVHWSDDS